MRTGWRRLSLNRDDYIDIFLLIISIVGVYFIWGYQELWDSPVEMNVPVMWYWQVGNVLSVIFASTGSISIYTLVILYCVTLWRPKKFTIPKDEIIENLRRQRKEAKLQLKIARSQDGRKIHKILQLEAIINLVKERGCQNCLAELEGWLETEALI